MPSSEKGDLTDPGLYQKEENLTISGKIVSLTTPRQVQIDGCISVRDTVLEENGDTATVSLWREAATGDWTNCSHYSCKSGEKESLWQEIEFNHLHKCFGLLD